MRTNLTSISTRCLGSQTASVSITCLVGMRAIKKFGFRSGVLTDFSLTQNRSRMILLFSIEETNAVLMNKLPLHAAGLISAIEKDLTGFIAKE